MSDSELKGKGCVCVCVCPQSCLTLRPHGLYPVRLLCPWKFPGNNIGVGYHFPLQGIFLTQGSNQLLLHLQADCFPAKLPGKLQREMYWGEVSCGEIGEEF